MGNFTFEEMNLMCIYIGVVKELRARQQFDKPSVLNRLKRERAIYVQKLQQVEE